MTLIVDASLVPEVCNVASPKLRRAPWMRLVIGLGEEAAED